MQPLCPWLAQGPPALRQSLPQPLLGAGGCAPAPLPAPAHSPAQPLGARTPGLGPHSAPPGARTPTQSAPRLVWRSSTPAARPAWAQLKAPPPEQLDNSNAASHASSATVLLQPRPKASPEVVPRQPDAPDQASLVTRLDHLERTVAEVSATCKVQAAALERVTAERGRCEQRTEAVEQRLARAQEGCSGQDLAELRSTCLHRAELLERAAVQAQAACAERLAALEKAMAQEAGARAELRKSLEKDAREQAAQEAERVHSALLREMRDRMEGQKALRDEVQFQQQALVRLTSRVDEAFVEFRTEFPALAQEHASHKLEMERISGEQATSSARMAALERGIQEEPSQSWAIEQAADEETEKHRFLGKACLSTPSSRTALDERLAGLVREGAAAREAVQRLEEQLRASQEATSRQLSALCVKVKDSDLGVQRLVDARLAEAEASLRGFLHSATTAGRAGERPQRATSTATRRQTSPATFRSAAEQARGVRAPVVLFAAPK